MSSYRVLFYKTLLNSEGHNFKCLERQIDVQSSSPSEALVLAEQQLDLPLDADTIEVRHISLQPNVSPSSCGASVHDCH